MNSLSISGQAMVVTALFLGCTKKVKTGLVQAEEMAAVEAMFTSGVFTTSLVFLNIGSSKISKQKMGEME
jgi:hypothetical protein